MDIQKMVDEYCSQRGLSEEEKQSVSRFVENYVKHGYAILDTDTDPYRTISSITYSMSVNCLDCQHYLWHVPCERCERWENDTSA